MLAQTRGQALVSEVADYHPELERAEAATELHAVVGAVAHRFLFGRAKVFGDEREGSAQNVEARAVERREVEGREEPLVRVRDERVGALASLEVSPQFGDDCGGAGVGRVNVEPQLFARADVGYVGHGVNARRRGRADGGDDAEGKQSCAPVLVNQTRERARVHSELRVGRDFSERALAEAERDERLLD